uniref:Uncharacterized protein n=1 Tax=Helianthus annuus TaxID=4232 RepID=A0A251VB56_HELAN
MMPRISGTWSLSSQRRKNKQNQVFKRVTLILGSIARPSGILYTVPPSPYRENKLKVFT